MSTSPWHRSTWQEFPDEPGSELGYPYYHGAHNNLFDKDLRERQNPFQNEHIRADTPGFTREGARNDYGSCASRMTSIFALSR